MATFDVLVPVKNCRDYLQESLDSICCQSFRDWRMFVLDHSSTDGSLEIAQRCAEKDPRVIVNSYPETLTLSELHNRGLEMCDGKYLLRQDADDISLPERMEVLKRFFEADRDLVALGSLGEVVDRQGRKTGYIDMPTGPYGAAAISLFRIPIAHPASAFNLEAMRRLGARYGDDFIGVMPAERRLHVPTLAEDYFVFAQLALVSKCMNISSKLIKYRWHGTNIGLRKSMEQLQMALNVSRYIAESFSLMHGVARFDPAPFCNHGERLFLIGDQSDFRHQYAEMRDILLSVMPRSAELERELAFRRVVADRGALTMAARYADFAACHGVRQSEYRTVRSWVLRGVKKQPTLQLASSGAAA
jgi:glycosyltransferase involved in cell wall biosynthesis